MKYLLTIILLGSSLFAESFYYEYGKKVYLIPSKESRNVSQDNVKHFETTDGKKVSFKNQILVKCIDVSKCESTLSNHGLTNFEKLTSTMYLINLNDNDDIFSLSQDLYNDSNIKFATPNIIKNIKYR